MTAALRASGRRAEELRPVRIQLDCDVLLALAQRGIAELVAHQRRALGAA